MLTFNPIDVNDVVKDLNSLIPKDTELTENEVIWIKSLPTEKNELIDLAIKSFKNIEEVP